MTGKSGGGVVPGKGSPHRYLAKGIHVKEDLVRYPHHGYMIKVHPIMGTWYGDIHIMDIHIMDTG